jgi:serine/threonine-protein kinase RsbW
MPSRSPDDGRAERHAESPADAPELHYSAIPAQAERLSAIRRVLVRWAQSVAMLADRAHDVTLATYGAMANAVEHAYSGRPLGVLELHAAHDPATQRVTVTVIDHGHWQVAAVTGTGTRTRPNGRGLILIHALADAVTIKSTERGTTVCMSWATAVGA